MENNENWKKQNIFFEGIRLIVYHNDCGCACRNKKIENVILEDAIGRLKTHFFNKGIEIIQIQLTLSYYELPEINVQLSGIIENSQGEITERFGIINRKPSVYWNSIVYEYNLYYYS